MKSVVRSLLFVCGLAGAYQAQALPLGHNWGVNSQNFISFNFGANTTDADFHAIIALSNCSGSLVRFKTSLPEDKAMVLTNGHCLEDGFLSPGEVVHNSETQRHLRLLTSDGQNVLATLWATKILYATMTDTDMTLYQVDKTYNEIQTESGVNALTLADTRAEAGVGINVISGYWRRIYTCAIDGFVPHMKEADWTWNESIRYAPGCDTIGGTSGSPIVQAGTDIVVGVNNTRNEDGEECTMNNPCEIDEAGNQTVHHDVAYGQQVYNVYGCLTENNEINLDKEGCILPKPSK